MTRFKFLLLVAVLIGFVALAHAGFDDGKAAYKKGDYAEAYKELKPLAQQGNAEAQFLLGDSGMLYASWLATSGYKGTELKAKLKEHSEEEAYWLRRAAEQGHAKAQCLLGEMYSAGQGVPRDTAEAERWFRKAADQGYTNAQVDLGNLYKKRLHPADSIEAVKWYRKAAEQGNKYGQYELAGMYEAGMGVERDIVLAYMWYDLGAAQGDWMARDIRNTIAEKMTPSQIAAAKKLASEWKPGSSETKPVVTAKTEANQQSHVSAKEAYELGEKCAKFCAEWVNKQGDIPEGVSANATGTTVMKYSNHYNSKLNQCLALVTTVYIPKDKSRTIRTKALYKVHDNKEIAGMTKFDADILECKPMGEWCRTEEEWDALVKPYMEE